MLMNCWYCNYVQIVGVGLTGPNKKTGEVPTLELDHPCRNCGATYHINIQLGELPKVQGELLEKIRNKPGP